MKNQRKIIFVITLLVIVLVSCYLIYEWVIFKPIGYLSKLENYDDLKLEILKGSTHKEIIFKSDDNNVVSDMIETLEKYEIRRKSSFNVGGSYIVRLYNKKVDLYIGILGNQLNFNGNVYEIKPLGNDIQYAEFLILEFIEKYENKI